MNSLNTSCTSVGVSDPALEQEAKKIVSSLPTIADMMCADNSSSLKGTPKSISSNVVVYNLLLHIVHLHLWRWGYSNRRQCIQLPAVIGESDEKLHLVDGERIFFA